MSQFLATRQKYHLVTFTLHKLKTMQKATKTPNEGKTNQLVRKASKYFLRGFTAKEIGKLMDINPRTVQRWATVYEFAQSGNVETLETRIMALHQQGNSYTQIAKKCKVCKTTVYNYMKKQKHLANN